MGRLIMGFNGLPCPCRTIYTVHYRGGVCREDNFATNTRAWRTGLPNDSRTADLVGGYPGSQNLKIAALALTLTGGNGVPDGEPQSAFIDACASSLSCHLCWEGMFWLRGKFRFAV